MFMKTNAKTPYTRSSSAKAIQATQVVTLDMVARMAGVSPSTVSRILNGTAVVSDVKREAVDKAVATLGFVPNPMARALAGGRTLSIGVLTQAIDSPFYGVRCVASNTSLTARATVRSLSVGIGMRRRKANVLMCFDRGVWTASLC